jgi:mannose-6-phosphate isomerase
VLAAEPHARVWLGFDHEVSAGELRRWIEDQDAEAMLAAMNEVAVAPGHVLYVPAGLPHAIGPAVLIVELQEPTSFSILAEHERFGVDARDATLGLGWDVALPCFDRSAYAGSRLASLSPQPRVVDEGAGGTLARLFATDAEPYFQAYRARAAPGIPLGSAEFRVLVISTGEGGLAFRGGSVDVRAGETWVVPYNAGQLKATGELELIVCCPPSIPA